MRRLPTFTLFGILLFSLLSYSCGKKSITLSNGQTPVFPPGTIDFSLVGFAAQNGGTTGVGIIEL